MPGVMEYEGFHANLDHMPGKVPTLRVGGTVVFREGGWSARLEEGAPIGINPEILQLNLVIDSPDGGTPEVITPFTLDQWVVENPPFEYTQVQFRIVGSEGEPEPEILDVEETS